MLFISGVVGMLFFLFAMFIITGMCLNHVLCSVKLAEQCQSLVTKLSDSFP